jgi:hypothetical protein
MSPMETEKAGGLSSIFAHSNIYIYRVSQEERTIFWEVIASAILRDRAILEVCLGRPVLSFPPAILRKGRSIFWEVIVSVILSKKIYINMCPIPNGVRDRAI